MLRPGLRYAWRSPDTLQVGVDVPTPLIVPDLPPLSHALLARMNGVRDRAGLVASLIEDDLDPSGGVLSDEVLDRLIALGVVLDGGRWPGPHDRATEVTSQVMSTPHPLVLQQALLATRVTLRGAGRLGGVLAKALSAAGIGRVVVEDARTVRPTDVAPGGFCADDVGRPRSALSSGQRPAPEERSLVVVTDAADLVVESTALSGEAVPHLVVTCRELIGRVGPFVVPGETACHFCFELTRRDRDRCYPEVWRQSQRQPQPECGVLLAGVTAHLAASHIVDWATGGHPPSMNEVLEVVAPECSVERQATRPHPECGCAWPGSAA